MKKINLIFALILCLFLLFGCSTPKTDSKVGESTNESYKVDYGLMDLANIYSSLDELESASDLIAEVSITGDIENVEYEGANFTLSDAKVKEVIKGDEIKGNIKIFEVERFNINLTKKNDKFILFLQKYQGPVTNEDAYVITGVYQGKFSISNDNKVIYDAVDYNGEMTFQNSLNSIDVNDFKKKIKEKSVK
ncbi:hypothetical protein PghCCS26_08510 [Paenibacillus glycanilyticus]|uniref:Lipoprotein n=1 Tax=Paenibacillus glycanilyticus TaxID=126569 RepID=A0ABQ6NI63_9BACL|nr:hypothetical protein [Paenibacillus glycanilyticus]GMK43724.1 hypothetical protein PghCCS26_08510 [Paenibacillus glycanilyticus]